MIDALALALGLGSPVGYVVVGFALYKVWQEIKDAKRYAMKANHNSTLLLKSMIKKNLLDDEDLKAIEFDS